MSEEEDLEATLRRVGGCRVIKPGDHLLKGDELDLEALSSHSVDQDVARAEALRDALRATGQEQSLEARAAAFKAEANGHFKAGRYSIALKGYLTALWLLAPDDPPFPEDLATSSPAAPRAAGFIDKLGLTTDLGLTLALNVAAAALKLGDAHGARAAAAFVARAQPDNVKAALRLAAAEEALGDDKKAEAILVAAAAKSTLAGRELAKLKQRRNASKKKFEKMFRQEPLYSEEEQRARRREARQPTTIVSPDEFKEMQESSNRSDAVLSRLSDADRRTIEAMQTDGATKSELRAFYAQARDDEARRVGELMNDDEKQTFRELCETADEDTIDAAFDDIRRRVDRWSLRSVIVGVTRRLFFGLASLVKRGVVLLFGGFFFKPRPPTEAMLAEVESEVQKMRQAGLDQASVLAAARAKFEKLGDRRSLAALDLAKQLQDQGKSQAEVQAALRQLFFATTATEAIP